MTSFFLEHAEEQDHVLHDMRLLYPTESCHEKTREYYHKKKKQFFWMILGGMILTVLVELNTFLNPVISNENRIERNAYGKGKQAVHLKAYYDDGAKSEDIHMQIGEREYDENMVEQMLCEVMEQLPEIILGENASFDEVRSNLNLIRHIDGYPFSIRWQIDHCNILDQYGIIQKDETSEEGTYVEAKAFITYADYSAESIFAMRIYSPVLTAEEQFREQILKEIQLQETKKRTSDHIELPREIEGKRLIWRHVRSYRSLCLLVLIIMAAVAVYYARDQELHSLVKKRRKEMELDYAGIISKMTLFLGAGMTTKSAWQKIVSDYQQACETGDESRYAYEEMKITYHEMCSGISETRAYERFGSRIGLPRYQVLASIISQAVKRGTQGTIELLLHEMSDAFEERKNIARQLGEEAGTKLLLPIFLMLMIVMLIIILPAILSLRAVS